VYAIATKENAREKFDTGYDVGGGDLSIVWWCGDCWNFVWNCG
jgi:hypothetical protein